MKDIGVESLIVATDRMESFYIRWIEKYFVAFLCIAFSFNIL